MNSRSSFLFLFCFLLPFFLLGCRDELQEKGDQAFSQNKFFKAFSVYKQCVSKKPTSEVTQKFLKTVSIITANGSQLYQEKKYQECIDYLAPVANDKDYPSADARMLTALCYIYGFSDETQKIAEGITIIQKVLRRANQPIQVAGFPRSTVEWLEKNGISRNDISGSNFDHRDIGVIYRAFLYHNLGQRTLQKTNWYHQFPEPANWSEEEVKHLRSAYQIFSYLMHNLLLINNEDPRYYPALTPDVLIRGYATEEQASIAFVYLLLQSGIPAYLWETSDSTQVLVNIGNKWPLFDLKSGAPLLFNEGKELFDFQSYMAEKTPLDYFSKEELSQGKIWVIVPPRSIIPRLSMFTSMFQNYGVNPPPFFHFKIYSLALRAEGILSNKKKDEVDFLTPPKDELSVGYFSKEFGVWKKYQDKEFVKNIEEKRQNRNVLGKARLYELQGKHEKALQEYELILNSDDLTAFQETTLYFQGVSFHSLGKWTEAKKTFQAYQEKYPQGAWKTLVHGYLGKIFREEKELSLARKNYQDSGRFSSEVLPFYTP